jgi:ABC-2 type transport system ATP-binding protein
VFNREDFYRVLLGVLEENETILLSTHLIEEVSDIISRAVLIRGGTLVGDASTLELEEQGKSLMDYVKETYHYRADRVSKALDQLSDGEA